MRWGVLVALASAIPAELLGLLFITVVVKVEVTWTGLFAVTRKGGEWWREKEEESSGGERKR